MDSRYLHANKLAWLLSKHVTYDKAVTATANQTSKEEYTLIYPGLGSK